MVAEPTLWSLGTLVEFERDRAVEELRDDLPGRPTLEEVWAHHIRRIDQQVLSRPAGSVQITTNVQATKRYRDLTRFTRYAMGTLPRRDDVHNI